LRKLHNQKKGKKAFAKDLKTVYTAVNEEVALENLNSVKEEWGHKYPNAVKSWKITGIT